MKFKKRITALITALLMVINLTAAIPAAAQTGMTNYAYDGYSVDYTVRNEWDGHQSVDVRITNTGTEPILNWALCYDAGGEITGLWNGTVHESSGSEYIIKNAGYNYEIAPYASVNFGYTLVSSNPVLPEKFEILSKRVDISEGFDVQLRETNNWGTGFQGEIVLTNTSDAPLEAWTLSFETNFPVNDLWGGKILERTETYYKVSSEMWTNPIMPGASLTIGFTASLSEGVVPEIYGCIMSVVEIGKAGDEPYDPEITITATADYDIVTGLITVKWETTEPYGIFDILVSYDNEETFNILGTAENAVTYSFTPEEFELLYVKVVQTSGERTAESNICPVANTAEEIDWEDTTDSDSDGLPDVYELHVYRTDPKNPDTDSDMLPDGYEVLVPGTDPAKSDSDDNGIPDGSEDFDSDGLSNLDEYSRETDPLSADTDGDGLNDYEEIFNYGTNPLKWDTDDDKVSDGDEIALGLDPNNPATHGCPDSEYTVQQTVGEDSESLQYINSIEDNPFTVTLELNSAGVADNNITAQESGYSYQILQNEAVLGIVPEFTYSEGLKLDEAVISFNLESYAVQDRSNVYDDEVFEGINRFNIFRMFEDNNILLPIETFYDEANNRVYAKTDELGSYCLIDMEKWFYYLESLPEGDYFEDDGNTEPEMQGFSALATPLNGNASNGKNPPANIVFCIDTREANSSLEEVKANVKEISEWALSSYSDVRIFIYTQENEGLGAVKNVPVRAEVDGEIREYFTTVTGVEKAVEYISGRSTSPESMYDLVEATRFMIERCGSFDDRITAIYHIVAGENVMGEIEAAKGLSSTIRSNIGKIYVSTLCPLGSDEVGKMAYASQIANISGGIMFADGGIIEIGSQDVQMQSFSSRGATGVSALNNGVNSGLVTAAKENIQSILGTYFSDGSSLTISPLGLKLIKLNEKLTDSSGADFDQDGLTDWNEIDIGSIESITKVADNNSLTEIVADNLPTIMDCLNHFDGKYYIEGAKAAVSKYAYASGSGNWNINVLPLLSDPTSVDGDGDGYWDSIDNLLNGNQHDTDDSQPLKTNKSSNTPFRFIPARRTYVSNPTDLGKLTFDNQKFLYFLAAEYDIDKYNYFLEQGYELDSYVLISICIGENDSGKYGNGTAFGEVEALGDGSVRKAESRAISALISSGLSKTEEEAKNILFGSERFFLEASRALSYWDNSYSYQKRIDMNHVSLLQSYPNVIRWREEIKNNNNSTEAYYYRLYDFKTENGKYDGKYLDSDGKYKYDDYMYNDERGKSLYYQRAKDAEKLYREEEGRNIWTGKFI